jgi:glycosyltransferase involved in cell wall biosynthesis
MSPLKVALVCDPLEEQWPSMDLVADMLFNCLKKGHPDICVEQLRPPIKKPLSHLPSFSRSAKTHNAERLLHRFLAYPSWLRKRVSQFDVFHIVDHSYSQLVHELPPASTVVSCHDLDTFRCILEPQKERRSRPFRLMTKRILDGFSKASRIICDSNSVRDELVRHKLVPANRIDVILHAAHPECSPYPDPEADAVVEKLLKLNPGSRYLLHVGSTIPRKRIDVLLKVFAEVRATDSDIKLVRVGGPFTASQEEIAHRLDIRQAIHVLPHIDRRTLSAVYRRADLLLITSDAEGFGLPVTEAMACGCPVVASDLKVLREIGGDAAVFCPPDNPPLWAKTVSSLLVEKLGHQASWLKRKDRGLTNAARFTWENSAAQFVAIYRAVMHSATALSSQLN